MCEEISILRRWQHVSDRAPCHCLTSVTRPCTLMRGLTSSFDRNFLVILLVLHTSKRVRCHLDASSQSEVEVIETVLATLPSRHVSRYMATCWLWLGDFHPSIHPSIHRRRFLQVNTRWKALAEIYTMHSFAPFSNLNFFVKNRQKTIAIELMNIH